MKKNYTKTIVGLSLTLMASTAMEAQISVLQDYQNNYSANIGIFQGVPFREAGFSGLYPIPNTNGKEFWTVSDRGVNVDAANANMTATPIGTNTCKPTYDKIYGFPTYAPKIHRIKLNGDSLQILNTISIKRPNGTGATGLLNPTGFGSTALEVPSTDTVKNCLNFLAKTAVKDVWGIDSEGIIVDKDGNFWLCEEGGPTIWKLNPQGKVIKRFTPYGNLSGIEAEDMPIDTVFKYRKNNRGFEGIAMTPNGKIYTIIQSPLLYPTKTVGEGTRVHRILEIDPATNATKMFAYLNDSIVGASGANQIRLRDWKIGDMAAINDSTFLVLEAALRGTTDIKRMYLININQATPVTSGLYSGKTLEALVGMNGLMANNIKPVKKTLFMDLMANAWPAILEKAEGLAILNDSTIAIGNDNDYGQTTLAGADDGVSVATTIKSHVITYRLKGINKIPNFKAILNQGLTGLSSSQSPYLVPTVPSVSLTSILTVGDMVGSYKLAGLGDGLGAFDNDDNTFTLLMAHEINNSLGVARAHGQKGAFVSKWVINKNNLSVVSGSDLIQNVKLWNGTAFALNTTTLTAFSRFCSADLPSKSAFYNAATGLGSMEKIFMSGEETGAEGRAFAHIATGTEAGTSYEIPRLGKYSFENAVASPSSGDKTVVVGLDDATPGQVYVYIGTKTNTGNDIDKAGLTNGKLYGVAVTGMITETNTLTLSANTTFSLVDLGNVENTTGATLQTNSNNSGVTSFLRPEDGAWDPSKPNDFYFATTNGFTNPSRLWRLRFDNVLNPENGGTIEPVLDGTEGQKMLDNLAIDNTGRIILQEDPGNQTYNAKIWEYNTNTDALVQIAEHEASRFITGGANFLTQDEESSGMIDVQSILGAGQFLFFQQAHYTNTNPELVEGGQLLSIYNPKTDMYNPEINVQGNNISILDGDATPVLADNTNFGSVPTGSNVSQTFVIQNTAAFGALNVTGINITGAAATSFSIVGSKTFSIAAGASQSITVQFAPTTVGTKTANIHVINTDFSESSYTFKVEGEASTSVGIKTTELANSFNLYPNPVSNEAKLVWNLNSEQLVTVNVYDIQGKANMKPIQQKLSKGSNTISLSTEGLADGIYFIQVKSEGKTQQIKMVIIH